MDKKLIHQFNGFLNTASLPISELPQFEISESFIENEKYSLPSLDDKIILGKRAEHFFEAAIKLSHDYEIIASNIQIVEDKLTLGEIDFLIRDLFLNKTLHIELVYKFYVYDPAIEIEDHRWIGPNRKDSLVEKITRLKSRQFPILYKDETQKILKTLNLDSQNISQKVCFKAKLFIPYNNSSSDFETLSKELIVGKYISYANFNKEKFKEYEFFSPQKRDWMISPIHHTEWLNFDEINVKVEQFILAKRSPLLWIKKNENIFETLFIVWW